MKNSRLGGLIAFIIAVLLVGGLVYYELTQNRAQELVAFGPAVSSDELTPPGDQPIVPPASLTQEQPAAPANPPVAAANPPAPAATEPPPATAPAAPNAENQMAASPTTEAPAAPTPAAPPSDQATAAPPAEPPADQAATEPPAATPPPAADQQVATGEPPAAPEKPAAPSASGPVLPSFDVVRVEPSGETVVAGQAAPEAKVEVLDGTAAVATATANDRGEWAMALDDALKPGTHDLAIRTTSKDGAVSTLSDQRVAVQVPEAGSKDVLVVLNSPNAPSRVLELPKEQKPGEPHVATAEPPPAVTKPETMPATPEAPKPADEAATPPQPAEPAPSAGTEPPQPAAPVPPAGATAEQPAEPAQPTQPAEPAPPTPEIAVSAVEADTAGTLYVAGTATTGEPVRVYLDGKPLGDAKPSPSGTWLVEVHREVPPGSYHVRADQVSDTGGTVVARAEVPFERTIDVATLKASGETGAAAEAKVSGQLPAVQTVIIKRGDNLWRIARSNWGSGIRWSTLYQANKDQIRNPHWIYPGQVFVMPVSPDVAND